MRPVSSGQEASRHSPVVVQAAALEAEDLFELDIVVVGVDNLCDAGDFSRPVAEACHLNYDLNDQDNLLPDDRFGQSDISHENHRLDAVEAIQTMVLMANVGLTEPIIQQQ